LAEFVALLGDDAPPTHGLATIRTMKAHQVLQVAPVQVLDGVVQAMLAVDASVRGERINDLRTPVAPLKLIENGPLVRGNVLKPLDQEPSEGEFARVVVPARKGELRFSGADLSGESFRSLKHGGRESADEGSAGVCQDELTVILEGANGPCALLALKSRASRITTAEQPTQGVHTAASLQEVVEFYRKVPNRDLEIRGVDITFQQGCQDAQDGWAGNESMMRRQAVVVVCHHGARLRW